MDSGAGARARTGNLVCRRAPGRRAHSGPGCLDPGAPSSAAGFRIAWACWIFFVWVLGPLVSGTAAAYLLAAILMVAGTLAHDAKTGGMLIAIAGALSMFTLAPSWATAIDLGGTHAAVLSATMNTAGQVGGILSPIVLAYIVDRLG